MNRQISFLSFFIFSLLISVDLFAAGKIKFNTLINVSDYKGQSYLSLMQEVIKPSLDEISTAGFKVVNGRQAVASLKLVDQPVASKALRAAGGQQKLKEVADQLARKSKINFYDLPAALADEGIGRGRYDLTTYLALVSGGGVALQINENNFAYNVNYGSGEYQDDEKTGRSFGESFERLALDASDRHYLATLDAYVHSGDKNLAFFFQSILEALLNSDTSNVSKLAKDGQSVYTDFLAVYTAEQDRHLMSNLRSHPWDIALLEVTLLSAFHSGQKQFMLMYNGDFTSKTLKQAPGCNTEERPTQKASMIDYWQYSSSTDPENCSRSGLNVGRRDFRRLGAAITAYQRANNPELVARVEKHFRKSGKSRSSNLFSQLTSFIVDGNAPKTFDRGTLELAKDFTAFLMQAKVDANKTNKYIVESWKDTEEEE